MRYLKLDRSQMVVTGLLCALMMLALAACGGDDSTPTPTATTTPGATSPTATPTSVTTPTSVATSVSEATFPRMVEHHMGSTDIPEKPERAVAVTDWYELDNLLAIGVRPVLYGFTDRYGTGVSPWAEEAGEERLVRYDATSEIDFERIAAADPDIIFVEWFRGEEAYETLSQIAPTIVLPRADADETGWRLMQRTVGEAMGLDNEAEQAIAETEQVLAEQKERLAPYADRSVTIAYGIYGGSNWFADSSSGASAYLLNDLGMELAPVGPDDNTPISVEQIGLLDDTDVLISYDTGGENMTAWESNPLFMSLPAVQEGRYVPVSPVMLRAVFAPTTLSVRWAASGLADSIIDGAQGQGKLVGGSSFPVTLTHKYGSTTIEEKPVRVVTVGFNEQDYALAVGVVPVGVREWLGGFPFQDRPWARDIQGVDLQTVGGTELDFEQIAALNPDVILGLYAGLSEDDYNTLSQIAPTVVQPAEYGDWGIPWQQQQILTGRVLGYEQLARDAVAEVESRYEQERAAHPEFEGKTAAFVSISDDGFWIFAPDDIRTQFLTSLGFELTEQTGQMSHEQASVLDVDVLVVVTDSETFESDSLYGSLDAVSEGRVVYLNDWTDDLSAAIGFNSPLSLGYLLDGIVPRLAAAVDGDTATDPNP